MSNQFRMDSVPGSLIVVGGTYEPWLSVLEQVGWCCTQIGDLRKADALFRETGPCIGIVDLSHDEFSLNGIANLVSSHRQVRWLAFIRESQLGSDTICQFIVNFCIDFFTSPIPDTQLLGTIGHQLGMLKLEKKVWPQYGNYGDLGLSGESLAMKRLRDQIKRIAPTDVNIFICGESGSGKEQVAKAVHYVSSRSSNPFVIVNCSAMSEKRFETEVFGIGVENPEFVTLLEQADGGTVFFKEILSISERQQLNLLRFFQEGTIETVKGLIKPDIRIVTSNTTDIDRATAENNFSEDLYHSINVLRVNVPSLRERSADIPLIARFYLQQFSREYNAQARGFTDEALDKLSQYRWPGNIRELINQVKRMVLMSDDVMLTSGDLDLPEYSDDKLSLKMIRERSEKDALMSALDANQGQITMAAKELEISRATIYRLLNKYNLISDEETHS
ncbi:sigma-54-dependent transcriptional regulator [Vibrio quintilis]|uniref:Transcriptional regulatory protein ZraR n=1 Tax=Vibrio quintilis TaxID=1117707 RepID=A0A1M7YRM5_9VIBR|nr:sigma-54 dependent transcriptional regulator [Vibrio quintilis]SHO55264.1 Transcriptional regulatory protein ZraR [Vibrio quintilis]